MSSAFVAEGPLGGIGQQYECWHRKGGCQLLDAAKGQVPLAALQATEVGPMDAELFGEDFLRQSARIEIRTVITDPERSADVIWAFDQYASGD